MCLRPPAPLAGGQVQGDPEAHQVHVRRTARRVVEVREAPAQLGHRVLLQMAVSVQGHGGLQVLDVLEAPAHLAGEGGVDEAVVAVWGGAQARPQRRMVADLGGIRVHVQGTGHAGCARPAVGGCVLRQAGGAVRAGRGEPHQRQDSPRAPPCPHRARVY